jgi:hypothetical protein
VGNRRFPRDEERGGPGRSCPKNLRPGYHGGDTLAGCLGLPLLAVGAICAACRPRAGDRRFASYLRPFHRAQGRLAPGHNRPTTALAVADGHFALTASLTRIETLVLRIWESVVTFGRPIRAVDCCVLTGPWLPAVGMRDGRIESERAMEAGWCGSWRGLQSCDLVALPDGSQLLTWALVMRSEMSNGPVDSRLRRWNLQSGHEICGPSRSQAPDLLLDPRRRWRSRSPSGSLTQGPARCRVQAGRPASSIPSPDEARRHVRQRTWLTYPLQHRPGFALRSGWDHMDSGFRSATPPAPACS